MNTNQIEATNLSTSDAKIGIIFVVVLALVVGGLVTLVQTFLV